MTFQKTKMLILAAVATSMILSGYGIADAVQPDHIKQKIQDKVPKYLQEHVTQIFDLAKEKNNSEIQSEIDSIDEKIKNDERN